MAAALDLLVRARPFDDTVHSVYPHSPTPYTGRHVARRATVLRQQVVRVLTWPLPGQRMWLAWCGGLNLAEFGFFFFLMGVVFCWLRYGLDGGYKYYNDGEE